MVIIDEIGTEAETRAARTISQRGVQLFATAHGSELENVIKNPSLVDLVGGVGSVTLGALQDASGSPAFLFDEKEQETNILCCSTEHLHRCLDISCFPETFCSDK